MGYYTHYKLEWSRKIPTKVDCPHCGGTGKIAIADKVAERIKEKTLDNGQWSIAENLEDSTKWYEHEKDMLALSVEFPDVVFTLHGEGEESADVWVKYFKGGKMQTSKLSTVLAAFDPSKLK